MMASDLAGAIHNVWFLVNTGLDKLSLSTSVNKHNFYSCWFKSFVPAEEIISINISTTIERVAAITQKGTFAIAVKA